MVGAVTNPNYASDCHGASFCYRLLQPRPNGCFHKAGMKLDGFSACRSKNVAESTWHPSADAAICFEGVVEYRTDPNQTGGNLWGKRCTVAGAVPTLGMSPCECRRQTDD